jgi:hypothetical protein
MGEIEDGMLEYAPVGLSALCVLILSAGTLTVP